MTTKGIIFSTPMVRALLAGTKTQTRRLAKVETLEGGWMHIKGNGGGCLCDCDEDVRRIGADYMPYAAGDRLYVRECIHKCTDPLCYRADMPGPDPEGPWVPSIHMPRWASRLWLEVTEVRVQRLQDISHADAVAEGINPPRWKIENGNNVELWTDYLRGDGYSASDAVRSYATLWDSLHTAPGTTWADNPWIVAISFNVNRGNIDG